MLPVRRPTTGTEMLRNPFAEMERLTRDLLTWADTYASTADGFHAALADLEETEDAFVLEVDLPGVKKKDVDVQLEGRRVVITAERKEPERTGILRHRSRTVGSYRHEVALPTDVRDDAVEARLDDGVLTVRLPKAEAAQRRRISVA